MPNEADSADSVRDSVRGFKRSGCSAIGFAEHYGTLAIEYASHGDEERARKFAKYAGRWANIAYALWGGNLAE